MPISFFEPFFKNFEKAFNTYRFRVNSELHDQSGFGRGLLRLSSERYFIDFSVDGMGPKVTMAVGQNGQPAVDVAWVFAYLTRAHIISVPEAGGSPSPGLYFFPHLALNIWGDESVAWQTARLAEILQPLWSGMLIFLDMDGPRSIEFLAFRKRLERADAERAADVYQLEADQEAQAAERAGLGFAARAQKSFAFLAAYGFVCKKATPLMVRYETAPGTNLLGGGEDAGSAAPGAVVPSAPAASAPASSAPAAPPLYITVFHRARSYALGVHTGLVDDSPGAELNIDMEELAAWSGARYTHPVVRHAEEMPGALNRLSRSFRQLAAPVLAGDTRLYQAMLARRIDAARRASRVWADRNRDK